jgi:hypothetical protein
MTTSDLVGHPTSLAALPEALDLEGMSQRLSLILDGTSELHVTAARLIGLSPGLRGVVEYETVGRDGPGPVLIGKIYNEPVRAYRTHTMLEALHALSSAGLECGVPRPLALLPDLGMSLYEESRGCPLDRLEGEELWQGVCGAAHWLANFHGSAVPVERRFDLDTEMGKLATWAELVAQLEPDVAPMVGKLLERLGSLRERIRLSSSIPIHKDFHYHHVLVEDGRVVVIDLDEARAGDPACDVAHFGANLRLLAFRHHMPYDDLAGLESAFVDRYASRTGYERDLRHLFFYLYTCLKIAKQLVRGRGPVPAPTGQELSRQLKFILEEGLSYPF